MSKRGNFSWLFLVTLLALGFSPLLQLSLEIFTPRLALGETGSTFNPQPWLIQGNQFIESNLAGHPNPVWLSGINYEGYTDRGWKMWEDQFFDLHLIDQDFKVAQAAGYNILRIFVQAPLAHDISAQNFQKLDKVIEIARAHKLRLLVTLADYGEAYLQNLIEIDRLISFHLRGNPTIVGFDLKNEPQFGDLAGVIYPGGSGSGKSILSAINVPLQTDETLIKRYGERMTPAAVEQWRLTEEGQKTISVKLEPYKAYLVANAYQYWKEFNKDAKNWTLQANLTGNSPGLAKSGPAFDSYWSRVTDGVGYTKLGGITDLLPASKQGQKEPDPSESPSIFQPKSFIDYLSSNEGRLKWAPLLEVVNRTLSGWISLRRDAIRGTNPEALLTIGYNDLQLANLPSNKGLSFFAPHIYGEASGLPNLMLNLNSLQTTFPDKPLVLGEFGSSTVQWPDVTVNEEITAGYEAVVWLWLWQKRFAGGFKWVLNNAPGSKNPIEANYGLLGDQRQAKQNLAAAREVLQMVKLCQGQETPFKAREETSNPPSETCQQRGGEFSKLELGTDGRALTYTWRTKDIGSAKNTWNYLFSNESAGTSLDKNNPNKKQANLGLNQVGQGAWSAAWRVSTGGVPEFASNSSSASPINGQGTITINLQSAANARFTLDLNSILGQAGFVPANFQIKQASSQNDPRSLEIKPLNIPVVTNSTAPNFPVDLLPGGNFQLDLGFKVN